MYTTNGSTSRMSYRPWRRQKRQLGPSDSKKKMQLGASKELKKKRRLLCQESNTSTTCRFGSDGVLLTLDLLVVVLRASNFEKDLPSARGEFIHEATFREHALRRLRAALVLFTQYVSWKDPSPSHHGIPALGRRLTDARTLRRRPHGCLG